MQVGGVINQKYISFFTPQSLKIGINLDLYIITKDQLIKLISLLYFSAKTDPKGVDAAFMKCFENLTDPQTPASLFGGCFSLPFCNIL